MKANDFHWYVLQIHAEIPCHAFLWICATCFLPFFVWVPVWAMTWPISAQNICCRGECMKDLVQEMYLDGIIPSQRMLSKALEGALASGNILDTLSAVSHFYQHGCEPLVWFRTNSSVCSSTWAIGWDLHSPISTLCKYPQCISVFVIPHVQLHTGSHVVRALPDACMSVPLGPGSNYHISIGTGIWTWSKSGW